MVFGQISLKGTIHAEEIVRNTVKEIGYQDANIGIDYNTATIVVNLDRQSVEIAKSVHLDKKPE